MICNLYLTAPVYYGIVLRNANSNQKRTTIGLKLWHSSGWSKMQTILQQLTKCFITIATRNIILEYNNVQTQIEAIIKTMLPQPNTNENIIRMTNIVCV